MEVAPFFVDFHHFLSIFTIFYRFSRFMHFYRDLHFVAIYALFPQIFFGQNSITASSHVFCMYGRRLFKWICAAPHPFCPPPRFILPLVKQPARNTVFLPLQRMERNICLCRWEKPRIMVRTSADKHFSTWFERWLAPNVKCLKCFPFFGLSALGKLSFTF